MLAHHAALEVLVGLCKIQEIQEWFEPYDLLTTLEACYSYASYFWILSLY